MNQKIFLFSVTCIKTTKATQSNSLFRAERGGKLQADTGPVVFLWWQSSDKPPLHHGSGFCAQSHAPQSLGSPVPIDVLYNNFLYAVSV